MELRSALRWSTTIAMLVVLFASTLIARADTGLTAYSTAIARVPRSHWSLVTDATIDPTTNGQAHQVDSTILLPPYNQTGRGDAVLWHEVGHVWFYNHAAESRAYCDQFWPHGRPIGKIVSRYAGTSCHEDEAESYAEWIERGRIDDYGRHEFFRTVVFR